MRKWLDKWGSVLALAISALGLAGGLVWLGGLEARVSMLERRTDGLEPKRGARGDQCASLNDAWIRALERGKSEQVIALLKRSGEMKCGEFSYSTSLATDAPEWSNVPAR